MRARNFDTREPHGLGRHARIVHGDELRRHQSRGQAHAFDVDALPRPLPAELVKLVSVRMTLLGGATDASTRSPSERRVRLSGGVGGAANRARRRRSRLARRRSSCGWRPNGGAARSTPALPRARHRGLTRRAAAPTLFAGEPSSADPPRPWKFRTGLLGSGRSFTLPTTVSSQVDYEGKVGVVIGRRARELHAADALT